MSEEEHITVDNVSTERKAIEATQELKKCIRRQLELLDDLEAMLELRLLIPALKDEGRVFKGAHVGQINRFGPDRAKVVFFLDQDDRYEFTLGQLPESVIRKWLTNSLKLEGFSTLSSQSWLDRYFENRKKEQR